MWLLHPKKRRMTNNRLESRWFQCVHESLRLLLQKFDENECRFGSSEIAAAAAAICCLSMQFITFHVVVGCRKRQCQNKEQQQNKQQANFVAKAFQCLQEIERKSNLSIDRDRPSAFRRHPIEDDGALVGNNQFMWNKHWCVFILHESGKIDDIQSITHCKTLKIERKKFRLSKRKSKDKI